MQPLAGTLERNAACLRSASAWSADNCGSPHTAAILRESGETAKAVLGQFAVELDELARDIHLAALEYQFTDGGAAGDFLARIQHHLPA